MSSDDTTGWPFVRRTPENPGSTADAGPRRNPVLQWKHDAHARVFGTPLVFDGRVYVATCAQPHWDDTGCLVAIDSHTGERAWMAADDALEIRGTPGIHDGKLYAADLDNREYVLDVSDGRTIHKDDEFGATPPDGVCPLVHEGTVYTTPYSLTTFDAETWSTQWEIEGIVEPPAVSDGLALVAHLERTGEREFVGIDDGHPEYVLRTDASVKAVDAETGNLRWELSMPGQAHSPAILDGVAFVTTNASEPQGERHTVINSCSDEQPIPDEDPVEYHEFGTVHAVDIETGAEYWSTRLDEPANTMPAVYENTLCYGTCGGRVVALDSTTGDRRWDFQVNDDGRILSWPTIAADTVYVGSRDECLYALDRRDGSLRWCYDTEAAVDSNPAVVDGTVYVGDILGNVYAIGEQTTGSTA